jgi:hypothetical protein
MECYADRRIFFEIDGLDEFRIHVGVVVTGGHRCTPQETPEHDSVTQDPSSVDFLEMPALLPFYPQCGTLLLSINTWRTTKFATARST